MHITEEMLQAAVKKAIELDVLPRRKQSEDLATNSEIMHEILQAALHPDKEPRSSNDAGTPYGDALSQ